MKINLTPYSNEHSKEISEEEYKNLVQTNDNGWSHCSSKEEYMAKLHYLRSGFHKGKIDKNSFLDLENKIVINYWNKGS